MIALEEDRQAIVMGLGRFGGGLGATRYLLNRGMRVLVTDQASEVDLEAPIRALQSENTEGRLQFKLGGHGKLPLKESDLLVVNPAVPEPWNNIHLQEARKSGILICTEIELLLDRLNALKQERLIAVTGSAGKSTTCAMIDHLAKRSGHRTLLGGNIGGSLLNRSDEDLANADVVVLEISSFMLHWIQQGIIPFEPAVGVLTTLDENHVDWHGSLDHYISSKSVIRRAKQYVGPINAKSVSNSVRRSQEDSSGDRWWSTPENDWTQELRRELLDAVQISLPGEHQKENAATACIALTALASAPEKRKEFADSLPPLMSNFQGLDHRLNPLGIASGVLVVDDSKSTTPEATRRAVMAFDDPGKIHLIAGGFDKKADLSQIASLSETLGGLYGVGQTGHAVATGDGAVECHTIADAVTEASKHLEAGDVLLLSPGCASWDQFNNYEERGHAFRRSVERSLGSLKRQIVD